MAFATASKYLELTILKNHGRYLVSDSGICAALILISMALESRQEEIPWNSWVWTMPLGTAQREPNFRRSEDVPIKAHDFKCECPPHNECVIEFKVNKDMVDFLNLRGLIKNEELKKYREELQKLENSSGVYQGEQRARRVLRNRRSSTHEENCCCPPTNVYMPSFITERKFDELVKKMNKKKN